MSAARAELRIGTRESALALWQADHVAERLRSLPDPPVVEIIGIRTGGDRIVDVPLAAVAGKSFFTKEIEQALLDGEVDLAVHSLKDLATEMPPGLILGAILERGDPRDALLSRNGEDLAGLPPGARVGTSSLRRRALIARHRPELDLRDLRGNVPTRIGKLDDGELDALVLAAAGVQRLGLEERISAYLPPETVPPAVGQGAVAVQLRAGDEATLRSVLPLDHPATRDAVTAERALLRRLEGGCQVPVGALGTIDGARLRLMAAICSLDGRRLVEGRQEGGRERAAELGESLAGELLERGGLEILEEIRRPAAGERR